MINLYSKFNITGETISITTNEIGATSAETITTLETPTMTAITTPGWSTSTTTPTTTTVTTTTAGSTTGIDPINA